MRNKDQSAITGARASARFIVATTTDASFPLVSPKLKRRERRAPSGAEGFHRFVLNSLAGLLVALTFFSFSQQNTFAADGHWVTTWGCGPQLTENAVPPGQNNLPPAPLAYSTLRQFVHTTIGGQHLRVRFSNAYGTNSVVMNSVHVALAAGTGSAANGVINTATDTALTFRGAPSITIPPGVVVLSDPVAFNLPPLTNLAISIYYGFVSPNIPLVGNITGHPGSRTTSYIQPGNVVSASSMLYPAATNTAHWYTITGVDALADASGKAVVDRKSVV